MTLDDYFVSVGFVEKMNPLKLSPFRRYFLRMHDKDLTKIMDFLAKQQKEYDPMREIK